MSPGTTRRRRIRSIALRMMVFLLLGAVVNVAVAWGCVLNHGFGTKRSMDERADEIFVPSFGEEIGETEATLWRKFAPTGFKPEPEDGRVEEGKLGYTLVFFDAMDDERVNGDEIWQDGSIVLSGWPTQSLISYRFHTRNLTKDTPWQDEVNTFLILRAKNETTGASWILLTRVPIWPGFAINTLFYATILWLLFAFPFTLRRWRRLQRGLCAKCAYPVGPGKSDVCTECGASIPHTRLESKST